MQWERRRDLSIAGLDMRVRKPLSARVNEVIRAQKYTSAWYNVNYSTELMSVRVTEREKKNE